MVQNGFMEKLICNKNLALSAKAPSFLSKAYKGSEGTGQQGKRDPDVYNSRHFLFLFLTGGGQRTARMASSNTVLRPRCVRAEHSRYFTAPVGDNPLQRRATRQRNATQCACPAARPTPDPALPPAGRRGQRSGF